MLCMLGFRLRSLPTAVRKNLRVTTHRIQPIDQRAEPEQTLDAQGALKLL